MSVDKDLDAALFGEAAKRFVPDPAEDAKRERELSKAEPKDVYDVSYEGLMVKLGNHFEDMTSRLKKLGASEKKGKGLLDDAFDLVQEIARTQQVVQGVINIAHSDNKNKIEVPR